MNRDPWSGEQVRFERRLPRYDGITGPYNAKPAGRSVDWLVMAAIIVLVLIGLAI